MIKQEISFCRTCLEEQYNNINEEKRIVSLRQETVGSSNFASTIMVAYRKIPSTSNKTDIPESVQTTINALDSIVGWPNAGWLSWEMRRFIRRAAPEEISEFGDLITEVGKKLPYGEKTIGYTFLDMDDLVSGGTTRKELNDLSEFAQGKRAYCLCDWRQNNSKLCLDLPELQAKCDFAPHALNYCTITS
ncbi:MAG: hypothetical protein WCV81_04700 [Microgenomates group bacterium]|jgi:hypothetical protein